MLWGNVVIASAQGGTDLGYGEDEGEGARGREHGLGHVPAALVVLARVVHAPVHKVLAH